MLRRFCTSCYKGVQFKAENEFKKYVVSINVEGKMIDGGSYWTDKDAAMAYDDLAKLYFGAEAHTNFKNTNKQVLKKEISKAWKDPKEDSKSKTMIPVRKQEFLSKEEIVEALEKENGMDIQVMDLNGKTDLAQFMIFVTGRSQLHMVKMADMLVDAIKMRKIKASSMENATDGDFQVEGRDCDDWMIVDLQTIVVHFLRKETRQSLQLENHWSKMVNNVHSEYGELNAEEYVAKYGTDTSLPDMKQDTTDSDWK